MEPGGSIWQSSNISQICLNANWKNQFFMVSALWLDQIDHQKFDDWGSIG
jgi:hypothetical protein